MTCPDTPDPAEKSRSVTYTLRLVETQAATGFFMPGPDGEPDFDAVRAYLGDHPHDEFMHRYALDLLGRIPLEDVRRLMISEDQEPWLTALLMEAILTHTSLAALRKQLAHQDIVAYRNDTPLLVLRSESLPDQDRHRQWAAHLKKNLQQHQPLAELAGAKLPHLDVDPAPPFPIPLDKVPPPAAGSGPPAPPPSFEAVVATALERLEGLGILAEQEMRHESSLSPIALMRRWRMQIHVQQDRHQYRFQGLQTAYGKGLSLERARASCLMEIVERCSAFARVEDGRLPDTARELTLLRGRLSELQQSDCAALDPATLGLEVPYEDQSLYWIPGTQTGGQVVNVPFQAVYLFANLDEICLFSGLGSTGLAAGGSLDQAKFHALLECIERDAEAVQPFDARRCFRLATRDAAVDGLLADYRGRGIDIVFQDCTGGLGIPCYKCFVYGPGPAELAKGTSAHFAGWQAALAALTETPYPYPHGPASRPGPPELPVRYLEELPDYASGNPTSDLQRLESLLAANHIHPIYVELTRRDLQIPVVRALIPGFELMADFDRFTRISPRLYRNYRQNHSAPALEARV